MSQKLSNREEGQVKAREVDQKLDEIAWSKDPTLNLEELEKIAMVMTSMETPNQSLQYKRHVLYDLLVDEKPLTEILDKIEASGDSPYSKNINPKPFFRGLRCSRCGTKRHQHRLAVESIFCPKTQRMNAIFPIHQYIII